MANFGFKERLKRLRKRRELTQVKAASLIGISYKALQDHEGGRCPNKNNLRKYALFYDCDEAWLLTGRGEPSPGDVQNDQHADLEAPYIKDTVVSSAQAQPAPDLEPPNIGGQFMEDINHLKVIYDYEDLEIINAIHSNLRIFNRTVQREMEVKDLKQKVAHLEQENTALRARIDNLEAAVDTLMAEREAAQTEKKAINA